VRGKAQLIHNPHKVAGVFSASINGAELNQDSKTTQAWYGRNVPIKDILSGQVRVPNAEAKAFVNSIGNAKESAQSH